MLMHAALPGTQHLNDSKSASAPLLGMGHSTELHQLPPFSLDIEHFRHCLSEMKLAPNRVRGSQ